MSLQQNLKMEKEYAKRKRRRLNPTHRWRDEETLELINSVLVAVRESSESFEKPTGQRFYENIKENATYIKDMNWIILKSKMRNLKSGYISAVQWQNHTGSRLLANGQMKTVEDNIKKLCPHFGLLEEIFQHIPDVNNTILGEATSDNLMNLEDVKIHFEDVKINFDPDDFEYNSSDSSSDSESLDQLNYTNASTSKFSASAENGRSFKTSIDSNEKTKMATIKNSNSMSLLMGIQEKMLDLERKKFQWQIVMDQKRLELRKLELQQQYDIKKLKLQKNERLERERMKLENEAEERIKKLELELKHQLK